MKSHRLTFSIFLLVGLALMIVAGFFAYSSQEKSDTYVRVEGQVIDFHQSSSDDSYTYYPIVEYTGNDGNTYTFRGSVGSSPRAYDINEVVLVMHPEGSPEKGELNDFTSLWLFPLIFGGMGFVFFAIGGGAFINKRKANQLREYLLQNGQKITTTVSGVNINRNIAVNGRNPFKITCQYHDTTNNTLHTYESENIWFDPTSFAPPGKEVTVYVDYTNSKKYYIDISFLPKQA